MASPTMAATSVHLHSTTGRLSLCSAPTRGGRRRFAAVRASASEAMATEKLGIRVERNPPESRLSELGVRQWPKWGCDKSKFPWTYSAKETCYLLQGKVKVYPDGAGAGGEEDFVEIAAGDLVVFPKGMSCTWDVAEAVDKHYLFE
uniref:(S)-ureidoglycine aminohydrolase cupin domain-containing protein n=1 Tax=Leersia perrieri TaxID=77586 RepID=A0A0D9W5H8_9ORYZ